MVRRSLAGKALSEAVQPLTGPVAVTAGEGAEALQTMGVRFPPAPRTTRGVMFTLLRNDDQTHLDTLLEVVG